MCFLTIFIVSGCGNKKIDYAKLERDPENIGGTLTFVYDEQTHTAYFGGENQVVQYYKEDIKNGYTPGCKVGIKIIAPSSLQDYSKSTLEINGIKYEEGSFLETVDEKLQNFAYIYPTVSPDANNIKFKIKWGEKIKEQCYEVIIKKGTLFMNEKGEASDLTYEDLEKKDGQPDTENA